MAVIELVSFGHLHLPDGQLPIADRVEDVRTRLYDPAAAPGILELDGLDPRVQDVVLDTAGAQELLEELVEYATSPRRIAIGCSGGRHRASALCEILAARLRESGHHVQVEHRHVHLPRVLKDPTP
ncbi:MULTISPECIES: RNase adapter RapZ [unclassified Crossiella]|uniref:RapZ C-terminal domain-containing protein n=1 Tax=unclassified Crossiella TaxID=2620835 RepID=UPI001FFE6798|nr:MULTISPECIES: RNase adapter RapZ [unclassified Crossiella]MCK2240038.1 hypothetical protein [Crossiella sp. S99.2]MCK2252746.1 hypothetical protein [Crossiella sp. S99.1]